MQELDKSSSHYMLNVLKEDGYHLAQVAKFTNIDYHKLVKARNNEFELKESDYRSLLNFFETNSKA